jgi:membrane associated rhomboid family serine protease
MAVENRMARAAVPAYANRVMILACVAAFVLNLPPERFAFVPAYFFGTVDLAGPLPTLALWRGLFGHPLIHADPAHLVSNMLALWLLGDAVENALGHGRYLALFLAGTIVGALSEGWLAVDRMAPLIGASGAICALMGAFLWVRPRARMWAVPFLRLPVLWMVGAFAALNVAMILFPPPANSPLAEVGWGAHAGGILAGLLLTPLLAGMRR